MIGTSIGHPIDTIKIRVQSATAPSERSVSHIIKTTFQGEGMKGFFKGLIAPVVGTTPYNTMIFTTTELVKRFLDKNSEVLNSFTNLDFKNEEVKNFTAGCSAGAICVVIYNPVELIKCRAQVNRKAFINYTEEIPYICRSEGFCALYNGSIAALCRDVPAWGFYFWTYAKLKSIIWGDSEPLNSWKEILLLMNCGGLAGCASWAISYPYDIVNTLIKCE
jgi:solute carrier family 25 carnitine/acylcarnitine transporter 20/29